MLKIIDFKFHICTTLSGLLTFPSGGFIPIAEYFSTFLHWPHLLTFIKGVTRGAIPGWYDDLEALYNTPTIQNKVMRMKEFHNFINPFIDMCSPFKTKDRIWYSQRNKGQYNIGKLTREKSLKDVYLITIDKSESIQIPVKKSKKLISNTRYNQMEKQIVMPVKDIRKMHQIINEERNENILYNNFRIDKEMKVKGIMFIDAKRKFLESKFISEKVTVDKFVEITNQLRHLNNITIYTDDSCKEFDKQYGIGLGWIIPESINLIENDIRFKCYADHFLSSTKAELLAIITALAVVPLRSIVNVYTDSQNTINIVEEVVSNKNRDIQWSKDKNIISRNAILHMVKDLNLIVQCHKVKVHSNDKYNEEADLPTRIMWNEIFSGKKIQINMQTFNTPMIIPLWRGLTLDVSIKDTLQLINECTWTQKWLNQNKIKW
ncbi:hypothetical protein Glove_323g28 [Diversispora epigaea]|uniref:RNase H type-1 domain-containing protein n=1 Tax=Diversispora epigaea TaxID=1348612 RepID=A0A397HSJ5_9GLOM|nr:hypothetical protein Glove_323g28 [Diversispora epigaea]